MAVKIATSTFMIISKLEFWQFQNEEISKQDDDDDSESNSGFPQSLKSAISLVIITLTIGRVVLFVGSFKIKSLCRAFFFYEMLI